MVPSVYCCGRGIGWVNRTQPPPPNPALLGRAARGARHDREQTRRTARGRASRGQWGRVEHPRLTWRDDLLGNQSVGEPRSGSTNDDRVVLAKTLNEIEGSNRRGAVSRNRKVAPLAGTNRARDPTNAPIEMAIPTTSAARTRNARRSSDSGTRVRAAGS
jgi:hypothetical protein